MQNIEIARPLEEVADLLEAQRASPFRVQAYRRAAAAVRHLPKPLSAIWREQGDAGLREGTGVGERLAGALRSLLTTGRFRCWIDCEVKRIRRRSSNRPRNRTCFGRTSPSGLEYRLAGGFGCGRPRRAISGYRWHREEEAGRHHRYVGHALGPRLASRILPRDPRTARGRIARRRSRVSRESRSRRITDDCPAPLQPRRRSLAAGPAHASQRS